jgi:RND superfamily putative drug exporter
MTNGRDDVADPAAPSIAARDALTRAAGHSPEPDVVVVVHAPGAIRSATGRARVARVARVLARDPAMGRVAADPAIVSRDGHATYVSGYFRPQDYGADQAAGRRLDARLRGLAGVTVGGPVVTNLQISAQISRDLARAELLAFPLLFLLSLVLFRGVVAALLPVLVGGISILGTMLVLRLIATATPLSVFALNLVTGLGLGLAIDYSLFIVNRYREEIAKDGPGLPALSRTLHTAGRTVAFSAAIVASALASLLVFPERFLYSMGIGGAAVALLAAASALITLPALLALLGGRVDALALGRWRRASAAAARPDTDGRWYRLGRFATRRPGLVSVACAVVLLAIGAPFLGVRFGGIDARVLSPGHSARQVHDAVADDFPVGITAPIEVLAQTPRADAAARYAATLRRLPGVAAVTRPQRLGATGWQIDVLSRDLPLAAPTQRLVSRIRDTPAAFGVLVGGQAAALTDELHSLAAHLPLAVALLALSAFAVLFLMTGSVVLPVKALVMNLLTISAAFGLLVLTFQDGRLEHLLGYTGTGTLEAGDMVLVLVIVFALSTDYGVFLLNRIKEARDAGRPNAEAVAAGLERTGRIITAAALLFCVAVGAFATSEIIFIKEIGVGIVAAVAVDATLVRALLVPALMGLLGERNWWAPAPLRRLHARLRVREAELPVAA